MIKSTFIFILAAFPIFSFAQSDIPMANWAHSPVKIDGDPKEWSLPLRFYDDHTKLLFAFSNDSSNLYLCFQNTEERDQRKILKAGMTITLSTKGKSKTKVSIKYPLGQTGTPFEKPQQREDSMRQNFNPERMKNLFLVQNSVMEVSGFKSRQGLISVND